MLTCAAYVLTTGKPLILATSSYLQQAMSVVKLNVVSDVQCTTIHCMLCCDDVLQQLQYLCHATHHTPLLLVSYVAITLFY